ncbi:MAG: PTS sugar transporter subunit IIC [[Clostridium] scindens]
MVIGFIKQKRILINWTFGQLNLMQQLVHFLLGFILRFFPVAIITYLGANYTATLVAMIPDWMSAGFVVLGGVLPVIGFVMAILAIGRQQLLPYFVIGFILLTLNGGLSTVSLAVIAIAMAVLHVQFTKSKA